MKKTFIFTLLVCFSLFSQKIVDQTTRNAKEKFLYVMIAKKAKIIPDVKNPKVGILAISKIAPSVTYFSDRPARKAGKISLLEFLENWDSGKFFSYFPPNSAIVAFKGSKTEGVVTIPVILTKPLLEKKDKVQFSIETIEKDMILEKEDYEEVALYIDDLVLSM